MKKPHVNTAGSFFVAAKLVSLQNDQEVLLILLLALPSQVFRIKVMVVSGSRKHRQPRTAKQYSVNCCLAVSSRE